MPPFVDAYLRRIDRDEHGIARPPSYAIENAPLSVRLSSTVVQAQRFSRPLAVLNPNRMGIDTGREPLDLHAPGRL